PRVLLVRARAVELEQHPEAPPVDLGAERLAEPLARCARDDCAAVHVAACTRLVGAYEMHRFGGVVGDRVRPRAEHEPARDRTAPEVRRHRLAELDLARYLAPVGEAPRQRAVLRLRSDPPDLAVGLAVVLAPA